MPANNYSDFGRWVKDRREELGWTQGALAAKVVCSVETIRKIEQNRREYRPSEEIIKALATHLNISGEDYPRFLALGRRVWPTEAVPTPAKRLYRIRLPIVFLLVGILLVGVTLAAFWIKKQSDAASEVGILILVSRDGSLLKLETADRVINSGDSVHIGEMTTVTFRILNNDVHPVRIKTLVIGSKGPGAKESGWRAPDVPFPPINNLVLQPGEVYEYRQSRSFYEPGDYFVEPVFQNAVGRWGGIQPFTRIEFSVVAE